MNWKYEAIEKLKDYEAKRMALASIPAEIKQKEMELAALRSAMSDKTPVCGGGSAREDAMLSNIVAREKLKSSMKIAAAWVKSVDRALSVLGAEEHLVLERFYIHRTSCAVDRLCDELNIEKATVYRRRDAALRSFTIAMYGTVES